MSTIQHTFSYCNVTYYNATWQYVTITQHTSISNSHLSILAHFHNFFFALFIISLNYWTYLGRNLARVRSLVAYIVAVPCKAREKIYALVIDENKNQKEKHITYLSLKAAPILHRLLKMKHKQNYSLYLFN